MASNYVRSPTRGKCWPTPPQEAIMQTNPEQWARELLEAVHDASDIGAVCGMIDCPQCAKAANVIQAAFAEREARNLSDIQRLVWKDELAGICETLESCFDHGGPVRCGPCAIKASLAKGVEPDYTLPNLPEVNRLKRENARLVGALDRQCDNMAFVINHVNLHGFYDKFQTELEADRAILAALKDRTHG